jgi:hypothetical protein
MASETGEQASSEPTLDFRIELVERSSVGPAGKDKVVTVT